jgi:putative nucleotidyltransferase with HDIG domain
VEFRPEIPVLPHGRARALAALRDGGVNVADVVPAIDADPALTAGVLRAANSAASSPLTRIGNTRDAVVRIGLRQTRQIVAASALQEAFPLRGSELEVEELWRHLVTTAMFAQEWERLPVQGHDAFTAGLLHDVGRMAMAAQAPRAYAQVVGFARGGTDAREAELAVFEIDHVAVGEQIAAAWSLPDDVAEGIAAHHGGGRSRAARAVADAREAAELLGLGDGIRPRVLTAAEEDEAAELDSPPPLVIGGASREGLAAVAVAAPAAVATRDEVGGEVLVADEEGGVASAGERLITKLGGRDKVLEQAEALYRAIRG